MWRRSLTGALMLAALADRMLPLAAARVIGRDARVRARPGLKLLLGRADAVTLGLVTVYDVRVRRGRVELTLRVPDLSRVLPARVEVRSDGDALALTASAFGLFATARAALEARDGAVVLVPGGGLAGFGAVPLFRDARVELTGVDADPVPGGLRLTVHGRPARGGALMPARRRRRGRQARDRRA